MSKSVVLTPNVICYYCGTSGSNILGSDFFNENERGKFL